MKPLAEEIIHIFKGKRVLVTGASGYLASNLVAFLQNADCTIIRLTRNRKKLPSVTGSASLIDEQGDIRLSRTWESALENVDIVYHFASQTSVYVAEENPGDDLDVNVRPMLNLLETCRKNRWHPAVIFSGTVTEMGMPENLPVNEDPKDHPITIYDIHKLMAETYLIHYIRQGIVRGTVLRLANVYGPGPASSSADRGVINMMIRRAFAGDPLSIYGKGRSLRDYTHIDDVVTAFVKAFIHLNRTNGRQFVIGSGEGRTIRDVVNLIADRVALRTGIRVPVDHIDPPSPMHPIEYRDFVSDSSAFADAAGWSPIYAFPDGLEQTLNTRK